MLCFDIVLCAMLEENAILDLDADYDVDGAGNHDNNNNNNDRNNNSDGKSEAYQGINPSSSVNSSAVQQL